ncbi:GNAT family protein [uncultured Roseobacter sp.]|uniref:GNAT family N-acetyltransferase n=1 Tax=uncultured Roseobacter sp. TaxID=114847 RepID=UPI00260CFCD1|nr:GNAT family protein [uncultured Roseobacter sp.]
MTKETADLLTWRPMELADISRIADWFWHMEDAALFDRSLPVPVSADALRETWRDALAQKGNPRAFWFIADQPDGAPGGIGGLDAVNYIQGDAVLPFFVAAPFRKRGLAKAMTVALLDLAFLRLRLHRVTTFYRQDNTPSARVLESFGFSEEGRIREGWFVNGQRRDTVIAGILSTEWIATREQVIETARARSAISFSPNPWDDNIG